MSKDISTWFKSAKPGESYVYHEGFLAMDNPVIGRDAQRLAARGEVCLVQRRVYTNRGKIAKNRFAYVAVKTTRPNPDLTWPQWPVAVHDFRKPEFEIIP